MKGTLKRGRTLQEDVLQRKTLLSSSKDRAENLMIVDLMRNDLGRISEFGSVHVDSLFEVQKLPTVFQMTSTVRSRLQCKISTYQLLKALFPSGSVTGTPKLAAMRYVNELERSPRGVYCGAVGHFSPDETLFNVPIRTLTLRRVSQNNQPSIEGRYIGEIGVGSGIVADSNPVKEWHESRLKATFLLDHPPSFSLVETIRYENGWVRLSRHLSRLSSSAKYFGFDYDEEETLRALDLCSKSLDQGLYKVRLLLDECGQVTTEAGPADPIVEPVRLAFAAERTDRNDPFLFHKTTHRPLYLRAAKMARKLGLWDLLFTNKEGEVTEGSICNLFVKIDGEWYTPPQDSGLLRGIMREEMIAELNARVQPLRREDVVDAVELIVTNSIQEALTARIVDLGVCAA
jgi:para-aminobenzoate synthetase/4-amino-4-deoxychorismate lyase